MEDFRPFTLRELFWRKEALEKEAWNHTAWVVFHMPTFGSRARKWEECSLLKAPSAKQTFTAQEFSERVPEMKKHLPDNLTQEQKDQRWREYCQRSKANGRK